MRLEKKASKASGSMSESVNTTTASAESEDIINENSKRNDSNTNDETKLNNKKK